MSQMLKASCALPRLRRQARRRALTAWCVPIWALLVCVHAASAQESHAIRLTFRDSLSGELVPASEFEGNIRCLAGDTDARIQVEHDSQSLVCEWFAAVVEPLDVKSDGSPRYYPFVARLRITTEHRELAVVPRFVIYGHVFLEGELYKQNGKGFARITCTFINDEEVSETIPATDGSYQCVHKGGSRRELRRVEVTAHSRVIREWSQPLNVGCPADMHLDECGSRYEHDIPLERQIQPREPFLKMDLQEASRYFVLTLAPSAELDFLGRVPQSQDNLFLGLGGGLILNIPQVAPQVLVQGAYLLPLETSADVSDIHRYYVYVGIMPTWRVYVRGRFLTDLGLYPFGGVFVTEGTDTPTERTPILGVGVRFEWPLSDMVTLATSGRCVGFLGSTDIEPAWFAALAGGVDIRLGR